MASKPKRFTDLEKTIFQAGVNEGELREKRRTSELLKQFEAIKNSYDRIAYINEMLIDELEGGKRFRLKARHIIKKLEAANRGLREVLFRLDDTNPAQLMSLRIPLRYVDEVCKTLKARNPGMYKVFQNCLREQFPGYGKEGGE